MSPRILIAGTSYVADEGKRDLVQLWTRVTRHLNPDVDILLVDSASPFDPNSFLPMGDSNLYVKRFPDNVGALTQGGQDGSGRAFCEALDTAAKEYDYVAFIETDVIFALPVTPFIEKMHKASVKVTSPVAAPYQFPEFGLSFWSSEYLRESKFTARYDWQNVPKWPIAEWRVLSLVGEDYWTLPIHGCRNDDNRLNVANVTNYFPYMPPAYLTHCADYGLYYRLLDLNGVRLT